MAAGTNPSPALHSDSGTRTGRERIGSLGQRLARALLGGESREHEDGGGELGRWLRDERGAVGEEVLPRYPLARRGYECAAVDEHVSELERELAELGREAALLRAQTASRDEVADEIRRIGEQTSGVLIAAHEQREEMLRTARAEADRCISEARSAANAITAGAAARVRQLEAEAEAVHRERDRLLEDARQVSSALAALTQAAQDRIPPKS
jgi:hypothetical protein